MTTYYFSPSRLAFYPESLRDVYEASPSGWPEDGLEVTSERYEQLYSEHQQGRVFCTGPDGEPMTKEPDPPTPEQLAATERAWRGAQLDATEALVQRHRDELENGANTTLSAEQYQELQVYRHALREWPETEGFPSTDLRPVAPAWLPQR
ncbi:phage tail assembly chaperone [Achromobacter xylosoxidans]|uniref:phage tail assembly chaperone n=2 Tax=Alcaligenes xylosoxydans xylosoxydans TaxID=85698 RepID=UPI0006C25AEA|nr:phage tail assembly chaperone [Achromobacter xylosoxidans]MCH4571874.1 phage tail assembly chaperone [Achromobacter xylosoxidans]MDD7988172.1 phage tail assembly chaperone [Achromobacter xylosoxidans]NEV03783.1 phage tail protein [Achromobacter xylosoxidans]OMG81341.1 phage tail protein [Achromobacter xylosoxidans]PNL98268.1 phage tail protein [Achromobacter xylosoxidans]